MNVRNPALLLDGYKIGHKFQYPEGTTKVVSNWVCRSSRIPTQEVIFFGLQYYIIKYLIEEWGDHFFKNPNAVQEYRDVVKTYLGAEVDTTHIQALHDLGYLPIRIRALPEGARVPIRVPLYTIENTLPQFYWLPNFLETQMSATIWGGINSATIADLFRKNFLKFAKETGGSEGFIPFQGHDFSLRGMFGLEAGVISGMGHLLSFCGTDTVPAIVNAAHYYCNGTPISELSMIGCSVNATEHAVMCAGIAVAGELNTVDRLISKVYPTGIVSIVSDSFDFWKVVTEYLPTLKDKIMTRDGKVVIRPDSGDPVKILIGDPSSNEPAVRAGLIECLWNTFGGTTNTLGFKTLDSKIGAIYGDSINLERQVQILDGLAKKGFASDNIVLGIGSYTYQHNTRDTLGSAIKATYCEVDDVCYDIFKDPKTDTGMKKSIKGLPYVHYDRVDNTYTFKDQVKYHEFDSIDNALEIVFDGSDGLVFRQNFHTIRNRTQNS